MSDILFHFGIVDTDIVVANGVDNPEGRDDQKEDERQCPKHEESQGFALIRLIRKDVVDG